MSAKDRRGDPATTFEVLRKTAEGFPDAEAYVELTGAGERRALTFGAWFEAAIALAACFLERGLRPGDVVALLLPSSVDYAVSYAAALRIGAVTTGVNLRLGPQERDAIFDRTVPVLTVMDDNPVTGFRHTLPIADRAHAIVRRDEVAAIVAGKSGDPGSDARRALESIAVPSDPAFPAAIVWTSGTTGIPKGALFDHRCLRAVATGTDVLSSPGDRRLNPLPFAHVGYMTRLWDEIDKRICSVVTPSPWSAGSAISLLATEKITVAQGVPTQWSLVLDHPALASADISALRIAATGAAPASPRLIRSMRDRLGCPVVVRYTSTEASLGTGTVPGDADEVVATTVGRPVPGVELRLAAADGRPVGPGEVGRVGLRSAARMLGYVAGREAGRPPEVDPDLTATALDTDGWVITGDLGRLDASGNLQLVGRATEMLVRGGYNVYPAEVEAVLCAHPAVAAAAVVGAPDPVLGDLVCAAIVVGAAPAPTLSAMRDWVASRLADYKAPDRLTVLDELPVTAMGKVDKRRVAELVATAP